MRPEWGRPRPPIGIRIQWFQVRLWERWRWVLPPVSVFLVTRLFSTAFLMIGAERQVALPASTEAYHVTVPTAASPGYFGVVSNWDGQWYRAIAETGYPTTLPTVEGRVLQNEWAFLPAYPMLVRAVMWVSSWDFPLSATIVSLSCSGLAVVLVYRLVMGFGGTFAAFTAVLGLCAFPVSPVLQVAYAESLALLLLAIALILLERRRYRWLVPVAVCLSLTRQVVLALGLLVALHWVMRWRRESSEPFPTKERISLGVVGVLAMSLTGLWPAIAGLVTGNSSAYVETYAAWTADHQPPGVRGSWVGSALSDWGLALGVVLPIVALVMIAVCRPGARAWGTDLRTWSFVYPIYVLAITRPTPSLLRYLMLAIGPLWPLPDVGPVEELPAQAWMRRTIPLVFAALAMWAQYLWVTKVFTIAVSPDSQPFP